MAHLALDSHGGWHHEAVGECQVVQQRIPDGGDDARGEETVIQHVDAHQEVATHGDIGAEDEIAWPLADDLRTRRTWNG